MEELTHPYQIHPDRPNEKGELQVNFYAPNGHELLLDLGFTQIGRGNAPYDYSITYKRHDMLAVLWGANVTVALNEKKFYSFKNELEKSQFTTEKTLRPFQYFRLPRMSETEKESYENFLVGCDYAGYKESGRW